ncbi:MAG TPA: universal stress protein [Solirubrobacteraceae bacterium]|jgi:nucleotide-binding universal stress UspA family protein|nr:universal stress protein [Solirubrobacteraceae bacterium]
MAPRIVVSYDGTPDDDDAIALGKVFAEAGASVALAYVRHSRLADPAAEERESTAAAKLLEHGAAQFDGEVQTYVLFNPSTAAALAELIETEGFDVIVFGSSYRTPAGHIAPGRAAEQLLDGGPAAVGIAPAGYRLEDPTVEKISVVFSQPGDAAEQTATSLAGKLGAEVLPGFDANADLLVLASRGDAPKRRVSITAHSEQLAEAADCPVLAVANDTPLDFSL